MDNNKHKKIHIGYTLMSSPVLVRLGLAIKRVEQTRSQGRLLGARHARVPHLDVDDREVLRTSKYLLYFPN